MGEKRPKKNTKEYRLDKKENHRHKIGSARTERTKSVYDDAFSSVEGSWIRREARYEGRVLLIDERMKRDRTVGQTSEGLETGQGLRSNSVKDERS